MGYSRKRSVRWGGPFFVRDKKGKNAIIQNKLCKLNNLICIIQKNIVILRGKGFGEVAPNSGQHSGGIVRRRSAE